jgi:dihydropyrimidinase
VTADLVVRDVLAVLPDGAVHSDIVIDGGRITAVVPAGSAGQARQDIAGSGREAFPGAIDPHTHFRWSEAVGVDGDGFEDVCDAAVRGGVTSFLAHVIAPPDTLGLDAINPVLAHSGSVAPDFGLHYVLYPQEAHVDRLPELFEAGIRSYKMFFAYPERGFMFEGPLAIRTFEIIAGLGGLALIHAEDGHTIRCVEDHARATLGRDATIDDYFESRPARLEVASIDVVALWASLSTCPIYIVHLSTAPAVPLLSSLRRSGADITVETCPHYLALDVDSTREQGPLIKFAPALRTEADRAALWAGLVDGVIETVGTDHAGHTAAVKYERYGQDGIFGTPFGIPGLETMFPVLYTHGVVAGRISRERLAAISSTNAARCFGWFPRKGVIAEGADADLVLVDPDDERPVRAAELRSRAGYSPFEGHLLRGWPSLTIRRGEVVFDGKQTIDAGGEFIATDPGSARQSVRRS